MIIFIQMIIVILTEFVLLSHLRVMLLAIIPMVTLQTLSCLNGIVAFAYFAKQGCEPLTTGYINTPNEVLVAFTFEDVYLLTNTSTLIPHILFYTFSFQIMPYFVMHVLNYPGVPGVFCACVLSGSLRSVCSQLLSLS